MRGTIGHEVLAGAIGATSVLGGAVTSPLLAPVVDLVAAAATAAIAAHAVHSMPGGRGSTRVVLRHVARRSIREGGAPLVAHVLEAACRSRRLDTRALRALATLLGRAVEAHARPIALGLLGPWCLPLRRTARVLDVASAFGHAAANAELMLAVAKAAGEKLEPATSDLFSSSFAESFPFAESFAETADDYAPPGSGRFPIARVAAPPEAA